MQMNKRIKALLVVLFYLFFSNSIYGFDKNLVKKVNIDTHQEDTNIGINTDKVLFKIAHNEITYFKNKTFMVPIVADIKYQGKIQAVALYIFVDCRASGTIMYTDNFKTTTIVDTNTVAGSVKNYVCKSKAEQKNILWYTIYANKEGLFNPYVVLLDSIKMNNGVVQGRYSLLDRKSKKLINVDNRGKTPNFSVNCNDNSVTNDKGQIKYYYDKTSHDTHFLIDTVCGRNSILEFNDIIVEKTISSSKRINKTCTDLGFNVGTESYEKCVLQLLDE
jgi:hypothetical protein